MDAADQTESPEDELWDLLTSHRDDATPALFLTALLCFTLLQFMCWGPHRT